MPQYQGHSCYNKKDVDPAWGSTGLQLGYIVKRSNERKAKERPFVEPKPWLTKSAQRWEVTPRE